MSRLKIVLGLGGVGKTTVACSMGYHFSSLGYRTHILTIDPSRRLSTALGFEGNDSKPPTRHQDSWAPLSAQVISPKQVFIDFIESHSSGSSLKNKILESQLFNDLVNNLAGSQEFTSLETLYQVSRQKDLERIVLDTPPSQHTLAFFEAPKRFLRLFDSEVIKWFKDPTGSESGLFQKLFQSGTRKALMGFSLLTGKAFINELSLFFEAISNVREVIVDRMKQIDDFIKSEDVEYSVVIRPDLNDIKANHHLIDSFKELNVSVSRIFVNQAYPWWLGNPETINVFAEEGCFGGLHFLFKPTKRKNCLRD